MVAKFFDRHQTFNSLNGVKIMTGAELSRVIEELRERRPFFCELVGENGYKLLTGVGKDVGCAQYSLSDGSPPYLMATNNSQFDVRDCVEFLIDSTLTPVPRYYCLPIESVKRIAIYFLETGERSPDVRWEEMRSTAN